MYHDRHRQDHQSLPHSPLTITITVIRTMIIMIIIVITTMTIIKIRRRKEKEKTTPFGVSLLRSQVSYQAAQE